MNRPGAIGVAFLILVIGCTRERAVSDASTIAPAPPRPDTTGVALSTVGSERVVSTAGSPRPAQARTAALELVRLGDQEIQVRPMLPEMQTAFRVINDGTRPHSLRIAGLGANEVTAALQPGEERVLQMKLGRGQYSLSCAVPGHAESAAFMTYLPGAPLAPRQ